MMRAAAGGIMHFSALTPPPVDKDKGKGKGSKKALAPVAFDKKKEAQKKDKKEEADEEMQEVGAKASDETATAVAPRGLGGLGGGKGLAKLLRKSSSLAAQSDTSFGGTVAQARDTRNPSTVSERARHTP